MGVVRFSYHKTVYHTATCDAAHCHLWCGALHFVGDFDRFGYSRAV